MNKIKEEMLESAEINQNININEGFTQELVILGFYNRHLEPHPKLFVEAVEVFNKIKGRKWGFWLAYIRQYFKEAEL